MTTIRLVSDSTTAVAQVNSNFNAVSAAGLYGYNAFLTSGLNWGFYGGQFNGVAVADSSVALTGGATNYVVAHRITGAVTAATTTTNWLDTSTYLQLYQVVSLVSTISSFTDYRQAFGGSGSGGSGLSNWVEAVNTTAPNATVPVVSFTVSNAATNVDAAIVTKGTGGIAARVADNGTTNGNKRGSRSVDLQLDTGSVAANVASGTTSFLIGGSTNKATATNSGVAGGTQNTASGAQSFVGGGSTNTVSFAGCAVIGGASNTASTSNYAAVIAGQSNTSSGTGSVVVGGNTNTADSDYSVAFGNRALVRGLLGAHARSSAQPLSGSAGSRQARDVTLQANTANATPAAITTNGSAAAATNQFNLVTGSGLKVKAQIMVRNAATGDCGWWDISGACKNVAGTVSLSGTPVISAYAGDASLNTCVVAIVADNTNKCLQIQVTGIAATNLIWVGEATSVEVVS